MDDFPPPLTRREGEAAAHGEADRVPGLTLVLAASACIASLAPPLRSLLQYDRRLVLDGEIWRLATGHFVHAGTPHLIWNVLVFLVCGACAERLRQTATRWFLVVAPGVIGLALLAFDPRLDSYLGLSGVAMGLAALLALLLWRRGGVERWVGGLLAVLTLSKIGYELAAGEALFADFGAGIRVVPLAHAAGFALGAAWGIIASWPRRNRTRERIRSRP